MTIIWSNPLRTSEIIAAASDILDAVPAEIAGLWWAPGYPELTTVQMVTAAARDPRWIGVMDAAGSKPLAEI